MLSPAPKNQDPLINVDGQGAPDAQQISDHPICRQNIRAMMVFQAVNAMYWGVAMGPVFDKYVLELGHGKNAMVGMTESISGLVSLFVALPIGFIVDSRPDDRAKLLKYCAWVGIASTIASIIAVSLDNLWALYLALVLLGIFFELSNSAAEAIFADSVPAGDRSGIYTVKSMLGTAFSAVGPFLTAISFLLMGDEWGPREIHVVLIGGALLLPLASVVMLFFRDPPGAASSAESSAVSDQASPQTRALPAPSPRIRSIREASYASPHILPEVRGARDVALSPVVATNGASIASEPLADNSENSTRLMSLLCLKSKHVPYIIATSDFITAIGAGMTVKFFNLFFIEEQGFTASNINWLQTVYPLVICGFMPILQRIAQPMGRAQASFMFFALNVGCLMLLSKVTSLPLLLGLFLVRGGFANAGAPINRSILMDFTTSDERGLWNAIDSLTGMSWSGSAFIGGLLADAHDYRYTFLITGFVYLAATLVYAPLLGLVPRKELAMAEQRVVEHVC